MKLVNLIKELNRIYNEYGDIDVTVSSHSDSLEVSSDNRHEVSCVVYEDFNADKQARIFYQNIMPMLTRTEVKVDKINNIKGEK